MKQLFFALCCCLTLAACAAPAPTTSQFLSANAQAPASNPNTSQIDLTHLPIGDGKLSSAPQRGYVWACRVEPNAPTPPQNGSWIKSDGTFDYTAKAVVDGAVMWQSKFAMNVRGDKRVFTSNDLPNHATGSFPIAPTDDAYQTDRNPNSIRAQNVAFELPANPTLAARASCAPGEVGILLTGVMLFSAIDAPGRDAVAYETQDACQGHPQQAGVYHYHNLSSCLQDHGAGHSALMGYALDGFGIYGHHGENDETLTNAALDECHGHTHEIEWNGKKQVMYHYHATHEFPYTVGCLRGTPVRVVTGGAPRAQNIESDSTAASQTDSAFTAANVGAASESLRVEFESSIKQAVVSVAVKLRLIEKNLRHILAR